MWILCMTSSLSSHSTSASVSELSRLVTHTAVSSPKCNSEKRPLSNSVTFQTLFKWHRYCGILKINIVRKINTGIRYEPVYRPALFNGISFSYYGSQRCPKTAWLQTFFRISSFVFSRTKTFIQVWNYLRVSKWLNFPFWVNYPFKF